MQKSYIDKHLNRFMSKVDIPKNINQCWEWKANKDKDGYGRFKIKIERNGKMVFRNIGAHIFMCEHYQGEIQKGLIVMHSCDNPSCVNPSHLSIGTYAQNSQDRDRKGRSNHPIGDKLSFPGERNGNHRLTFSDVENIRFEYAKGNITQQKLADRYGVNQTNISNIILRKNWK